MRIDGRKFDELREIKITREYITNSYGSVLIEYGNTKVICTANFEKRLPYFLRNSGGGWIRAEYSMLPGSTTSRKTRSSSKGFVDGRSQEIQRFIGRSLRSAVNLKSMGERLMLIDCDVLQADGGTRTAAVTGSFIAMVDAFNKLYEKRIIKTIPINNFIAGVSVGMVNDNPILDLCYKEDHNALVDMNIVMTDDNRFIEVQGTGEKKTFSRKELNNILDLAEKGIKEIIELEKKILNKSGGFTIEK